MYKKSKDNEIYITSFLRDAEFCNNYILLLE